MKLILKRLGGFLLNLILTNKRETVPGSVVNEVEKTSPIFGLNLNDFAKGLLIAVLGGVIGDLMAMADSGDIVFDWPAIKKGAIVAGLAYLAKQFGTGSKTILKIIVLGLLFSISSYAQNNATVKALQSWNADSTTVRALANLDSIMGRETGWLYFNNVTRKWRVGIATPDSVVWMDLGSGSGGGLTEIFGANGVNVSGGNTVLLGGELNQNTTIVGNGMNFDMNGLGLLNLSAENGFSMESLNSSGRVVVNGTDNQLDIKSEDGPVFVDGVSANFTVDGVGLEMGAISGVPISGFMTMGFTSGTFNFSDFTLTGADQFILDAANNTSIQSSGTGGISFTGGVTTLTSNDDVQISATDALNLTSDVLSVSTTQSTFSNLSGSGTRMVTANASGVLGTQAIPSGGTPGGANTNIQYNDSGSFGGHADFNVTGLGTNSRSVILGNLTGAGASVLRVQGELGGNDRQIVMSSEQIQYIVGANTIWSLLQGGLTTSNGNSFQITPDTNGSLTLGVSGTGGIGINASGGGDVTFNVVGAGGSYIILQNIPTTCTGAPTGALANVAGVLTICP